MTKQRRQSGPAKEYRVVNGINWPGPDGQEIRKERGDMVAAADLGAFADGFIDHGDIESLEETAPAGEAAAEEKES